MKDYAAYIWPAYAISALVLGGLAVASILHARRWKARVEALNRKAQDG